MNKRVTRKTERSSSSSKASKKAIRSQNKKDPTLGFISNLTDSAETAQKKEASNVVIKVQRAGIKAASKAMSTMGFVVVKEDNWIVKKYADGRRIKLKKIPLSEKPKNLTLD